MKFEFARVLVGRPLRRAGRTLFVLGLLSSLLVVVTSPANATSSASRISLDDLVNDGEAFFSKSKNLRFSNFSIEILSGSGDLSDYSVKRRSEGFKLYGKKTGRQDENLEIRLRYDVEAVKHSLVMTAVALSSNKWNKYGGNEASIDVFNADSELIASGTRIEDRKKFGREYYDFSEAAIVASISEEITIDRSVKGKKWNLKRQFRTEKGYVKTPVPEPSSALMLGFGIAGIASYARRRR